MVILKTVLLYSFYYRKYNRFSIRNILNSLLGGGDTEQNQSIFWLPKAQILQLGSRIKPMQQFSSYVSLLSMEKSKKTLKKTNLVLQDLSSSILLVKLQTLLLGRWKLHRNDIFFLNIVLGVFLTEILK